MPDQKTLVGAPPTPTPTETAEVAFRRIARRKLLERGYPADQVDEKISALLQKGAKVSIDLDEILRAP